MKIIFLKRKIEVSRGLYKVTASVLENLAAGWIGSIAVVPGVGGVRSIEEMIVLLTYSVIFATLAIYLASRIEDSLYDK